MSEVGKSELWRWQRTPADVPPLSMEAIEFSAIAGWGADDHCAALECYLRSAALAAQPGPIPSTGDLKNCLEIPELARSFFENYFTPCRILAEPGLLTSYFEPVLKGSRRQSPLFPVPVYRRPPDLKPLPPEHDLCSAGFTAGREIDGQFEPYPDRAAIKTGALKSRGLELLYLADPIEAFIMHVQGSGFVELEDGTALRLSFDGKNGHPYTSISKRLVERGDLKLGDAHLEGTIAWLREYPERQLFLNENRSYIFFRELDSSESGPKGSSGVTLSAGRSLAADPLYHPSGTPIWVEATDLRLEGQPLRRLLIVQDTGSAITGPQRGDIFAGSGSEAGQIAGRVRHRCEFIVLRPKW